MTTLSTEKSRRQKRGAITKMFGSLAIGVAIYLTTNNTTAGAILPSIHAAWSLLRTGLWVLRVDHRRFHAMICFAFYVATAFWHAAAAAFGSVLLFVAVAVFMNEDPTMEIFAVTMLTLICGLATATAIGLLASLAAALTGIRVWVSQKLRDLVESDLAGVIELPAYPGFNHAIFVLATSLALPVLAAGCYLLAVVVAGPLTLAVLTIGPLLAFVSYHYLASRIIAAQPSQCLPALRESTNFANHDIS